MRTLLTSVIAIAAVGSVASGLADELPAHQLPPAQRGGTVEQLCDGETSTEVPGLEPGQALPRDRAQQVADDLMAQWKVKNPKAKWELAAVEPSASARGAGPEAAPKAPAPTSRAVQRGVYVDQDARDAFIQKQAVDALVEQGNQIFHSDKLLGGTVGISCDMCHPNAANTHPETYPKYQAQLQRVVLLRDMINWCIENPVRGKPLRDDDPSLKALEAYILAQRAGVPLAYGKH